MNILYFRFANSFLEPIRSRNCVASVQVDPVLKTHHRARPYRRGSWGPKEADALIAADGPWHNPKPKEAAE